VRNLNRFMRTHPDDARLALGLKVLRPALEEARSKGLLGWAETITEYVHALESGKPLNRPL
jgi:hypothetical protein